MVSRKKTDNQDLVVNDREQLIYLLTEAAEVEHVLMCSYLYAAWSLKQSVSEGITQQQLDQIDQWRKAIHSVAMEEMLHLALVNNLLMSIGAAPHLSHPNFPIQPGYYPAGVIARLAPFTLNTAEHFVYLERPEGMDLPPANGYEAPVHYVRGAQKVRLTPTAADYDTVTHLYRGIEHGFALLSDRLGEKALFLGHENAQITPEILAFDGLIAVSNLAHARDAINIIIEQGEGSRADAAKSHFNKFRAIFGEYSTLLKNDPDFRPYRDLAPDPVMFPPIASADSSEQQPTHIAQEPAAQVLDLANSCYGLMLRLLSSGFCMVGGSIAARKSEFESAITVMTVVKSLAISLTQLDCGKGDLRAGMNFHLPRSNLAQPQAQAGAAMLAERASELACALSSMAAILPSAEKLAEKLGKVASSLGVNSSGA